MCVTCYTAENKVSAGRHVTHLDVARCLRLVAVLVEDATLVAAGDSHVGHILQLLTAAYEVRLLLVTPAACKDITRRASVRRVQAGKRLQTDQPCYHTCCHAAVQAGFIMRAGAGDESIRSHTGHKQSLMSTAADAPDNE